MARDAAIAGADLAALTAAAAAWTGDVLERLRRLGRPRPYAAELERTVAIVEFVHAYFEDLATAMADPSATAAALPRLAPRIPVMLDWFESIDPTPVEDAVRRYYDSAFARLHADDAHEATVVEAYEAGRHGGARLDDVLAEHG